MPILKQLTAPNGAAVGFHKIAKIEIAADASGVAMISSWPSESDYLADKAPLWAWYASCGSLSALVAETQGALLVDGDFAGGTAVTDSADSLETARVRRWATIKTERTRRLTGTFEYADNVYDIDPVNIAGAAVDAREALIAGETNWTQAWVLANNTVVTLTATEMIALGRAAKAVVSGLWGTSQYLRGLIEAATTAEEVEAVVWPT